MLKAQLSVITNYRACLLECRDLVGLFFVAVCLWAGFLMMGVESLCLDMYVLWLGLRGGPCVCVYKYTLGSRSVAETLQFVCMDRVCL